MALNPFFLQGSPGEQRLVQDLINEHKKQLESLKQSHNSSLSEMHAS